MRKEPGNGWVTPFLRKERIGQGDFAHVQQQQRKERKKNILWPSVNIEEEEVKGKKTVKMNGKNER